MLSPPRTEGGNWTPSEPVWRPRQVGWAPQPDTSDTSWRLKIVVGAVLAALIMPVLTMLALYAGYRAMLSGELPPERPSVLTEMTRIYDATGKEIALLRQFDLNIPVSRSDIPQVLKDAVVSVEDRRFYSHNGVDDRAILRALWADIAGGGYIEGASTITQQYVRLAYITSERTLTRKLKEASLARRVEKELSKDEILHRYLSRVYLGSGAYGVGAAAQSFFRKPVNDLTISEAALLAGLIRAPSDNEPRSNPSGAEAVRQLALGRMLAQRHITQSQYDEALAQKIFLREERYEPEGPATVIHPRQEQTTAYPYYVDVVRRYLVEKYGDDRVYRGGLQVHTALDPGLQAKAEAAVNETLNGTSPPLEMSLVSVDPRNGFVRALIGGRDFTRSEVNLALGRCGEEEQPDDGPMCLDGGGTGRQPGSAFKPFPLARALEEGIGPDRVYRGPATYTYPNCSGEGCTVSNVESSGYGSLTLRQATAYSVNTVYAQLISDVGVKDTAEMANRLGLTMVNKNGELPSGEPYGPSLALGAAEVSPLDMAAAYGVFANRGQQMPATPVVRVETVDGEILEDNRNRRAKRALPENVADRINEVLQDVVKFGTGTAANLDKPGVVAGKTGTSEDYGDAWFVGYTPQLSTAVWMGFADSRKPLVNIKGQSRVFGGTFPAQTWKAYMSAAADDLGLTELAKPAVQPPPSVSGGAPAPPPAPAPAAPATTVYRAPAPRPTTPAPTTTIFPARTTTTAYRTPPTFTVPPRPTTTVARQPGP